MITIIKGEDKTLNLYITSNKKPYDLTGWTNIAFTFKTQYGGTLEKNSTPYNTKAYALYNGTTFTAVTSGTSGNSISLVFTGTNTIAQAISTWNTANPSNTVTSNSINPQDVFPAGTVNLSHGQSNLIDVVVISEVLGYVQVKLNDYDTVNLLAGRAINFKGIIDRGTPPEGNRRKIIFQNALEVVEDYV